MKRTKIKQNDTPPADAILTADFHLTETTPISRTDDYIAAQKNKLRWLRKLSKQNNNCPILCSGDIFHHWRASPWLCAFAFDNLPSPMITIPGNHDLPEHSIEQYEKSALSLLASAESSRLQITVLEPGILYTGGLFIVGRPFGELEGFDPNIEPYSMPGPTNSIGTQRYDPGMYNSLWHKARRRILLLHELVWPGSPPTWAAGSYTDEQLLERFKNQFDLILTGDNHSYFDCRMGDALLVNPGSMMRIHADQADYKPRCYLYYAEENIAEPVDFPIEENVHSRAHLDRKKEREDRITAYIDKMSGDWDLTLSFEKNLQAFFKENNTPKKVREIIWEHYETEKI